MPKKQSESGNSSFWLVKIMQERSFLDNAQIALKNERNMLRNKQESLMRIREQWKSLRKSNGDRFEGHHMVFFIISVVNHGDLFVIV